MGQNNPTGHLKIVVAEGKVTLEDLHAALDHAAHCSVLVVAAAGNQGRVGSSVITAHPRVIPVVACDSKGRPTAESNLGSFIGRHGLAAPGENIVSLRGDGKTQTTTGTSAAAPFVTGTIALLLSEFPRATASQIKLALTANANIDARSRRLCSMHGRPMKLRAGLGTPRDG